MALLTRAPASRQLPMAMPDGPIRRCTFRRVSAVQSSRTGHEGGCGGSIRLPFAASNCDSVSSPVARRAGHTLEPAISAPGGHIRDGRPAVPYLIVRVSHCDWYASWSSVRRQGRRRTAPQAHAPHAQGIRHTTWQSTRTQILYASSRWQWPTAPSGAARSAACLPSSPGGVARPCTTSRACSPIEPGRFRWATWSRRGRSATAAWRRVPSGPTPTRSQRDDL